MAEPSIRRTIPVLLTLLLWAAMGCLLEAFRAPTPLTRRSSPYHKTICLRAEEKGGGNNEGSNMNDMRTILESAWNVGTMGEIPTTPESAAKAASVAVRNVLARDIHSVSFVDIILPQYDVGQGDNMYDQVLAVDFCVELGSRLHGKSCIVVRDTQTVQTVSRILDKREENKNVSPPSVVVEEEEEPIGDAETATNTTDDIDNGDTDAVEISDASIDSFREKLKDVWDMTDDDSPITLPPTSSPSKTPKPTQKEEASKTTATSTPARRYRLCAMLGDSKDVPSGTEMQRKVVEAVRLNALPQDDEETLIILSAASPQELVGVRALVGKYKGSKTIILVNCRLNPLPRELVGAQTVYSILPLIAKPKEEQDWTLPSSKKDTEKEKEKNAPPKVVVMRRYPRDWEVFVDTGKGFELGATTPAGSTNKRGPSMQWVTSAVTRYLKARA